MDEINQVYHTVLNLLKKHHEMFSKSLPLIASENIVSPAVKEALISDFGHRYAEGWPGERVYAGCKYIDQVELITIDIMKKIFKAEFVDVRPISGTTANLAIYSAFTEPGDIMMALSIAKGGHISMGKKRFWGSAGLVHGLEVEYFEFDEENFNVDVDKTKRKIEKMEREDKNIKLVMFGGSVFLFPHPVKELADFLKARNIIVGYDAAHVAGLIAGGKFQDPLREGADVMSMSTHKTFFGPQRGAIASFEKYSDKIKKGVFPGVTSNHHLHTLAALSIAALEIMKFGREYAQKVVRTAKKLAETLYEKGFDVVGEKNGFTESHQILVDVTKYGLGGDIERRLEEAGIIVNRNLMPWDPQRGLHYENPGGIRLGVQELVRIGMGPSEMPEVAEFFKKVIIDKRDPDTVSIEVAEFREGYQEVHYCFSSARKAYEYLSIS